ncbi:hypothetical protein JOC94_004155 [Bacillus thermophilus]|uniref:Uncharacterized protein n=1 Tax=Siminovitchia thermophila TaxID=1245522 RepID=A0ABS2RBU8_9BACI|nr:hypothetical protein [Siminovitchia thermophila]MBM7717130.1 hypothetical protein [Siminovitchia thermophila]ONK23482.1 hypothetical protein BLX87_10765 [Bacillus sp. VT-16-64]
MHSFGVYFPAKSKEKETRTKGFHYTNPGGEAFFKEVESDVNVRLSKETMLKECSLFFHKTFSDIKSCKKAIHSRLTKINKIQQELVTLIHQTDPYIKKTQDHLFRQDST